MISVFVIIVLLPAVLSPSPAQWIQTNGPSGRGGPALSLCVTDSEVFVGASGRVYRSSNMGTNWQSLGPGLSPPGLSRSVLGIASIGSSLYAGFGGYGMFVSRDGGMTWAASGFPGTTPVAQLSAAGQWVIAGCLGPGYQSTDGGLSWVQIGNPPGGFNSSCLQSAVGLIGNPNGIYRSTDTGGTWTLVRPTGRYIYAIAIAGAKAFAGVTNTILSSADTGATWRPDSINLPCNYINSIVFSPGGSAGNLVFAGSDSGVFRSTDNGARWYPKNTGMTSPLICALGFQSKGTGGPPELYACTGSGVFRSSDFGETWTITGLPAGTWVLASSASSIYAGSRISLSSGFANSSFISLPNGNEIYRSDDLGGHWIEADSGVLGEAPWHLTSLAANPGSPGGYSVFAGLTSANSGSRGTVFGSTNSGASWSNVLTDSVMGGFPALAATASSVFLGFDGDGVYRSTNNGLTWASSDSGMYMPPYDQVPSIAYINAFSVDRETIYAGGGYYAPIVILPPRRVVRMLANYVFSSTNGGATWGKVDSGFSPVRYTINDSGSVLTCLYVDGGHIVVGTRAWNPTAMWQPNGGIYHSTGQGTSWTLADSALTGLQISCLIGVRADVFAGSNSGVFHSSDHGSSWTNISGGLADSAVGSLAIAQGFLFAATSSGVWRRPLSEITSVESNKASGLRPAAFNLSQNFPNPFNPSTTIRFGLAERVHVRLSVFTVLGQLVSTLLNGEEEPGYHEVRFDGTGLASGVYYYRLQAGSFVKTMKLLHLR